MLQSVFLGEVREKKKCDHCKEKTKPQSTVMGLTVGKKTIVCIIKPQTYIDGFLYL